LVFGARSGSGALVLIFLSVNMAGAEGGALAVFRRAQILANCVEIQVCVGRQNV
jgi:hypothetical protein